MGHRGVAAWPLALRGQAGASVSDEPSPPERVSLLLQVKKNMRTFGSPCALLAYSSPHRWLSVDYSILTEPHHHSTLHLCVGRILFI